MFTLNAYYIFIDKTLLDIAAEIAFVRQKWHLEENFVFYINFDSILIQQLNSDKRHFFYLKKILLCKGGLPNSDPREKVI